MSTFEIGRADLGVGEQLGAAALEDQRPLTMT